MTGRLRAFGRWLTDWRTGATVIAAVLVALLAVIVVDAIQSRRDADTRTDRAIGELERRGERITALAAQLEDASTARAQLAEEVRALRELLIDGGMLEPRAAHTANETPRTGPGASPRVSSSPSARPRPAAQPRPSPPPRPSPSPSPSCAVRNPITGTCLVPPDQKGRS